MWWNRKEKDKLFKLELAINNAERKINDLTERLTAIEDIYLFERAKKSINKQYNETS